MNQYSLSHLSDAAVRSGLAAAVTLDCTTTATLLAHIAEADERRLYLPLGYSSMYQYCVREFRMSEDVAHKRIRVARAARRFPAMYEWIADARLNLSAALLLAPHLTGENAAELLTASAHLTNAAIELMLAERFATPDLLASAGDTTPHFAEPEPAVRRVVPSNASESAEWEVPLSPEVPTPLSPIRRTRPVLLDQETCELLERARELLGHAVPKGDPATVIKRAVTELVDRLERRKHGKVDRPRVSRGSSKGRHVCAEVRRAVSDRDGERCAFISREGRRCEERCQLEYDHIVPVAQGGQSTIANVRLLCRAHNQYAAECELGTEFMRNQRAHAQERRARERAEAAAAMKRAQARAAARAAQTIAAESAADEVTPWLCALGFKKHEAQRAAALAKDMTGAALEDRVRVALRSLAPSHTRTPAPVAASSA